MKILIPDTVDEITFDILKKQGFEFDYKPGLDVEETNKIAKNYDALIVRSYKLHDMDLSGDCNLKAIARAGAGVNNIPIDKCSEKGIIVFNAPGANANAVKELVICSLILASRGIVEGIDWTKCQDSCDIVKKVEKKKGQFKGTEIIGKNLGVIGLGKIGMLVANAATSLEMNVFGFDPFITIENAWQLSHDVVHCEKVDDMLEKADYITVHVPYLDSTKGLIDEKMIAKMKDGVRLMNFARGEIVDNKAVIAGLKSGKIGKYITDFPSEDLQGVEGVTIVPHLGASTKEAGVNCAVMVSNQLSEFLITGNVRNSVNYPNVYLDKNGGPRIIIRNKNVPGVVNEISAIFAENKLNIHGMINKSRGDYAYSVFDIDEDVADAIVAKIEAIKGVIKVRKIDR